MHNFFIFRETKHKNLTNKLTNAKSHLKEKDGYLNKLRNLEERSRRNNICVEHIPGSDDEGLHVTKEKLRNVFFNRNWDSLHARLNSHNKAWSYKKKKHKKIKVRRELLYKESAVNRCLVILDL